MSNQVKARQALDELKASVKFIFPISLTFCMIWFAANYTYNYGLLYASITSSVVCSNTSPAWVYLLSLSCLIPAAYREKFDYVSALMILVSISGFVLVALEDNKNADDDAGSDSPVLGDVLSLGSALCYAIYATYLKIKVPEE